ncbi:phosphomannomutase [Actibacterium lipolyticum]|nr:phosphomannomutase [Actibacterium lipolyticum]
MFKKIAVTATSPACFKAYDVRGRIGVDIDEEIAYRIGASFAEVLGAKRVVVGHDCRESSPAFHAAVARGLLEQGVDVFDIGQAGTEEVYFATTHLNADGGIEITASHNPIDYNGMKFVGRGSRPLTADEFKQIGEASRNDMREPAPERGTYKQVDARPAYAGHLVDMVDPANLPRLKIVANAGNGVAGPALDAILERLTEEGAVLDIVRVNHTADGSFPNGIPNPLLPENRPATGDIVRREGADLGIAWDGDFDRCFFFDHTGAFVDGEYLVGLLANAFLAVSPGESIVHDPRVVWNTIDQVTRNGGTPVVARTGHAHIKQAMRDSGAIYGGEMSAHHYFRDFMCCDSGMIPWLKLLELMGRSGQSLADMVASMIARFPSSGEQNFRITDPQGAIAKIRAKYEDCASKTETLDGLSMSFPDWRFNLRSSATEPVVRLNVEVRGDAQLLKAKTDQISKMLLDFG